MKKVFNRLVAQPFWVQFFSVLLLMTAATVAVTVTACVMVKFVFRVADTVVFLVLIVVGAALAYGARIARQKQIRRAHITEATPNVIFRVLSDAAVQLGALAPANFSDIFSSQGDSFIGTAPHLCFEVFKSKLGTAIDHNKLIEYRSVLQARIDKLLVTGAYIWLPYVCVNFTSALTVLEVQDSPTMLYIHVAIVYDSKSAQDVANYQAIPTQRPPATTPKKDAAIPVALDKALLDDDVKEPVNWPYMVAPHAVVIGATGSGKTYFTKQVLHTALQTLPNSAATVCDFKADDFRFLLGRNGYYQYTDCTIGLQAFYDLFTARQSRVDTCRDFRLLVFDEWASYLQSLDKKQAEGEMKRMATLLMLGRSFGCHVLVSQQRGDAQYFSTARDNFGMVVALGNLSPESRDMFFKGYKDSIELTQTQGTGYAAINGGEPIPIQVRTVDMDRVEAQIAQHFTPKPPDGAGEA